MQLVKHRLKLKIHLCDFLRCKSNSKICKPGFLFQHIFNYYFITFVVNIIPSTITRS